MLDIRHLFQISVKNTCALLAYLKDILAYTKIGFKIDFYVLPEEKKRAKVKGM